MLKQEEKTKIIEKHKVHQTDTGSPDVQVALLTEEIDKLLLHLNKHPKDIHSRQGLLKMVYKRASLLKYLKAESENRYQKTVKSLKLKKKL